MTIDGVAAIFLWKDVKMLQWNARRTALLVVVLLVALAALLGIFDGDTFSNLTW